MKIAIGNGRNRKPKDDRALSKFDIIEVKVTIYYFSSMRVLACIVVIW